jgi:hypothetical protein
MREMRLTDLAPSQRQCISLFQSILFGRIENLSVREGTAVLEPPPNVVRSIKLTEQLPDAEISKDFVFRAEIIRFFAAIRTLQTGIVRRIEIRHGLPILMEIEESASHPLQAGSHPPSLSARPSGGPNE